MVNFDELENAYLFVNSSIDFSNSALINKKTGEIFYKSEFDEIDELPDEDAFLSDDYIAVPDRYELDLGQNLVFDFVDEFMPEKYEEVRSYFRRSGAYSRFKNLLMSMDLLDKWHEFEDQRRKDALVRWCKENGLEVEFANKK